MSLPDGRVRELSAAAYRARRHVLGMAERGGCFVGAALSCVDIITFLYGEVLRITPDAQRSERRDYFLLSKGHAVPALYAVLVEFGFLAAERLQSHLSVSDCIYWHPNAQVPGVEFHSGSLGHLLSVGMGVAYDARLAGTGNRVFVMLGDGELNEGSVWEGLLVAAALQLGNLTVIIDRNRLQANEATEKLTPLEPLSAKFESFGCAVESVQGHCFRDLERAFAAPKGVRGKPNVVVAETLRGKGVRSLEGRTDAWFVSGNCTPWLSELELSALPSDLAPAGAA